MTIIPLYFACLHPSLHLSLSPGTYLLIEAASLTPPSPELVSVLLEGGAIASIAAMGDSFVSGDTALHVVRSIDLADRDSGTATLSLFSLPSDTLLFSYLCSNTSYRPNLTLPRLRRRLFVVCKQTCTPCCLPPLFALDQ